MPRPFLSIGIIFRNEIRCLERCLKSLQPLRDAVPCELVMADTGSDDGSREVAEKYADILIDFPWINDFAAARNAVMNRCTGRWYLNMDADEWLDEDIRELARFVRHFNKKDIEGVVLCIRNYYSFGNNTNFGDFFTARMLRMSTGIRFRGAVHESWQGPGGRPLVGYRLDRTILHHDGYVGLNEPAGAAKRKRNQEILEELLKKDPMSVRLLLQYVESSRPDPQHEVYIRRAIDAVEAKGKEWKRIGPAIYRYAVVAAVERKLPELEEWIARAEELFPDSFFTRIDIAYQAFMVNWDKGNHDVCVRYGETCLSALEDFDAGRGDKVALMTSTVIFSDAGHRQQLWRKLAVSCRKEGRPERAVELLEKFEGMDAALMKDTLEALWELQVTTDLDTAPHMLRLYEKIIAGEGQKGKLWNAFIKTAPQAFGPDVREKEEAREDFHRHGYTVYLPLAGKCEAGNAAAVMEAESVQEMNEILGAVKQWKDFSISVLLCALERGASFPPETGTMRLMEMERVAKRLAQYKGRFIDVVCRTDPEQSSGSWQRLAWARSMVLASVQAFDWADEQRGLALAKTFTKVEQAFITGCYTPEVLREGNLFVLPPMHQFAWYCVQAFDALKIGDAVGYVRFLREGLACCEGMKAMVEFLTKHTPELQAPPPSPELLDLAEKVRAMLAAYSADDPAVAALKASPVYQKVAYLIEGEGA